MIFVDTFYMTILTLVKKLQTPNSVVKGISSRIRAGDFNNFSKEKWILSSWCNLAWQPNKPVFVYLKYNVA